MSFALGTISGRRRKLGGSLLRIDAAGLGPGHEEWGDWPPRARRSAVRWNRAEPLERGLQLTAASDCRVAQAEWVEWMARRWKGAEGLCRGQWGLEELLVFLSWVDHRISMSICRTCIALDVSCTTLLLFRTISVGAVEVSVGRDTLLQPCRRADKLCSFERRNPHNR